MYAILNGKEVKPVADVLEWTKWFETADRHVARTILNHRRGIWVSTVFLGIDHGFSQRLWFETMIFGTSIHNAQERYETWDQAERGHQQMVFRARQARQLPQPKRPIRCLPI